MKSFFSMNCINSGNYSVESNKANLDKLWIPKT